jgi:hypothetical protein
MERIDVGLENIPSQIGTAVYDIHDGRVLKVKGP